MGIMECAKNNCDNFICDIYVESIGFICNQCKNDFIKYLEYKDLKPQNEFEIVSELTIFLSIKKREYFDDENDISIDDFFIKYEFR